MREIFQNLLSRKRRELEAERARVAAILRECAHDHVHPAKDYWEPLNKLENQIKTLERYAQMNIIPPVSEIAGPTLSHFKDGVQYAWDSTSLSWAQKCLRYYKYKMIDAWEPRQLSRHLIFGQHYARALEHWHKQRAEGIDSDEALINVVGETLENTWIDGKPWDSMDTAKNRESLIRSIVWYVDTFEDEDVKTHILSDGRAAVEYSFTLGIDYDNFLCGHLDRVCTYGEEFYIMDQKTTGATITSRFFDNFNPDTQMSLYTFAGRAIFDIDVKGVIIDGAQIAVGFTRFERGFTFRTDAQLDEWYGGILEVIENTQHATKNDAFPMNPTACGNYGGCEFRGVCSKSPSVREAFLNADFKRRDQWNPLTRR